MADRITDNLECARALEKAASGDASALGVVYDRMAKKIFSLAFSILSDRDAAEDAMQETFLKILRHADCFRRGENARAWIMAIARNTSLDALRKRREYDADDALESVAVPDDFRDALEVNEMLKILDNTERDIVILKAVDGFRFGEIGNIIGISSDAARKRYRRAIQKLKTEYK